tara:strand:- start:799 stop:972 length:174 start_codon:yes stop_codon:yes gene_type:complete
MKIDSEQLEKRFQRIEDTLDNIKDNHLKHIEKYTMWTLCGVVVSTLASVIAVYIGLQ